MRFNKCSPKRHCKAVVDPVIYAASSNMLCIQFTADVCPPLDMVSVFGIVLYYLSRANLARPASSAESITEPSRVAPKRHSSDTRSNTSRLVAIVGSKECEEETEEIATLALRLLHIVRGNRAHGCRLTLLLPPLSSALLFACQKRKIIGSSLFRMLLRILFRSVVIPTTAFVVTSADRWMQRHIILV